MKDDIIVYDIETKESFQQVGSRDPKALHISAIGIYSYNEKKLIGYTEDNFSKFWRRLENCQLLIGYNSLGFDNIVVSNYFPEIDKVPSFDIMAEVQKVLGFRLKLDNIAQATLGVGKTADGLEAIKLYKEGRIKELVDYCLNDVWITKEIYDYALDNSLLFYKDFQGKREVQVDFRNIISEKKEPMNLSLF